MKSKRIIVAIDGHSSCGKSTMAKALARKVGYIYVDTGAMYRVVTLFALRQGYIIGDGTIDETLLRADIEQGRIGVSFKLDTKTNLPLACLNGEVVENEIRGLEVSNHVSPIAAIGFVREFLVAQQQEMGKEKGIVMDGRDIGTTVFPNAELKVFVTASPEIRARRRYDELVGKGATDISFEDVLANVIERDRIDSTRDVSPLRKAEDAVVLDNSNMTFDEQNEWLMERFNNATNRD